MEILNKYDMLVLNPSDPPCILKGWKGLDNFTIPYKVDIGSGENPVKPLDEWIHTSPEINTSSTNTHTEILCYAQNTPFDNGTVGEIFCQGTWEHFTYEDCKRTMDEWHRILQPGGSILFNFPPVDHALSLLFSKKVDFEWVSHAVYGWQRYKGDEHKSGWTEDYIQKWLAENYSGVFSIIEIFWGTSERVNSEPVRFKPYSEEFNNLSTPYDCPGAHIWVRLRKVG